MVMKLMTRVRDRGKACVMVGGEWTGMRRRPREGKDGCCNRWWRCYDAVVQEGWDGDMRDTVFR